MKPKAWIREDGVIAFFKQKEIDDQGFKWQPLYLAPQTKPLSDEEILDACITDGIYDCINDPYYDRNTNTYTLDADLIKFARAIEERHGIK